MGRYSPHNDMSTTEGGAFASVNFFGSMVPSGVDIFSPVKFQRKHKLSGRLVLLLSIWYRTYISILI
jgi:hypothetical protein